MPQAAGMYYFSNGEDDWSRPAVILIHGAGGNHLYWPPEIRRLAGQRIYAIDLPGHGKSTGIGRQSVADYAHCVLDFMDGLKLRKAIFVGHSMGAAIALELALSSSRRTLGVALLASAAHLRVAPELLEKTSTPATFPLAVQLLNDLAFGAETNARLKEISIQRMAEVRSSVLHGDFLACDAFDATARIARVKTPTLIVCGANDKMTPRHYSQLLHQKIKKSLLHSVEGAGHMVMLENPPVVANVLKLFLDGITYQPGSLD
jgi:pimeloyl-ACP methyl ester carboxylesterase